MIGSEVTVLLEALDLSQNGLLVAVAVAVDVVVFVVIYIYILSKR